MNSQSPVTNIHALLYVLIIVATAMLSALGAQLAAGKVPIPAEWSWVVPVLVAGVTSATMLLPRVTDTPGDAPAPAPNAPASEPTTPAAS